MTSSISLHERPLRGFGSSSIACFPALPVTRLAVRRSTRRGIVYPADAGWPAAVASVEAEVVRLVNDHRVSNGLHALGIHSGLQVAAEWKARHMAQYGYMAHDDAAPPIQRTVSDRLIDSGYPAAFQGWGENIAYGYPDPASVMAGWLGSPGHKQNLENPAWTVLGVGAALNGVWYWANEFGTGTAPPPPPPIDPPPAGESNTQLVAAGMTLLKGATGTWAAANRTPAKWKASAWAKAWDKFGQVRD